MKSEMFRNRLSPGKPRGRVLLVRPFRPAQKTASGLFVPDSAQRNIFGGHIVDAGDEALSPKGTLLSGIADEGYQIGDEIWWTTYGGTQWHWTHRMTDAGTDDCPHEDVESVSRGDYADRLYLSEDPSRRCLVCGAEIATEILIHLGVEQVTLNVSLQTRIERGEAERVEQDGKYKTVSKKGSDTWQSTTALQGLRMSLVANPSPKVKAKKVKAAKVKET